jgi:hypothetical protein
MNEACQVVITSTIPNGSATLPFVIPSAAEGSAVQSFGCNEFVMPTELSEVAGPAVNAICAPESGVIWTCTPNRMFSNPKQIRHPERSAAQIRRNKEVFTARSRRACPERSRGNPGDACWQLLF